MNTTCFICGKTYIPEATSVFCGSCREVGNTMVRMFNALWTEYDMGKCYVEWKDGSTLDKDFIVTDKCAKLLPHTIRIAFIDLYNAINKHRAV